MSEMPTLIVPYRTAILLTIRLQAVQSTREELLIVKDIIERLGVSNSLNRFLKPIDSTRSAIDPSIDSMEHLQIQLAPQEMRVVHKLLDEAVVTVIDLEWMNPLIEQIDKLEKKS